MILSDRQIEDAVENRRIEPFETPLHGPKHDHAVGSATYEPFRYMVGGFALRRQ